MNRHRLASDASGLPLSQSLNKGWATRSATGRTSAQGRAWADKGLVAHPAGRANVRIHSYTLLISEIPVLPRTPQGYGPRVHAGVSPTKLYTARRLFGGKSHSELTSLVAPQLTSSHHVHVPASSRPVDYLVGSHAPDAHRGRQHRGLDALGPDEHVGAGLKNRQWTSGSTN